jgi:hypothetical protein
MRSAAKQVCLIAQFHVSKVVLFAYEFPIRVVKVIVAVSVSLMRVQRDRVTACCDTECTGC